MFKKPLSFSTINIFSVIFQEWRIVGMMPSQAVPACNVLRDVKTTQKQSHLYQQSITQTINYGKQSKYSKQISITIYFFDNSWVANQYLSKSCSILNPFKQQITSSSTQLIPDIPLKEYILMSQVGKLFQ